jgi:protein-tyrosine phosphatase
MDRTTWRTAVITHRPPLAFALVLALAVGFGGGAPVAFSAASTITGASCEQLDAASYRIEYQAQPGAGAIRIYASARPDRIDSDTPLVTTRSNPVDVSVALRDRRVYFHLKPESGPTRVVATRRIPLEGAINFRDLGGYPAADGRFVRWGLVYRTEHLTSLTPRDYQYVGRLGIRLICDLRTPGEREKAPTKWMGAAPEFLRAPVMTDADLAGARASVPAEEFKRRLAAASKGQPPPGSGNYDRFVLEYADSYRQVFRRFVSGELPAAAHCTAGQDRTGVFSAMFLTMLGVPWDVVVQDYLLTSRYRLTDDIVRQRGREWQQQYGLEEPPSAAVVRTMQGLRAETLKGTFDTIARTYGSFDIFRREALGLSDADLVKLRDRLLEP